MADVRTPDDADDGLVRRGEPILIGNEFSLVEITKVWTRNGERLEIRAAKSDAIIRLDALELEALARQPADIYTALVQNANGA